MSEEHINWKKQRTKTLPHCRKVSFIFYKKVVWNFNPAKFLRLYHKREFTSSQVFVETRSFIFSREEGIGFHHFFPIDTLIQDVTHLIIIEHVWQASGQSVWTDLNPDPIHLRGRTDTLSLFFKVWTINQPSKIMLPFFFYLVPLSVSFPSPLFSTLRIWRKLTKTRTKFIETQ